MRYIPLTQGKKAIVDDEDYGFLSQWKWHFNVNGYAVRTVKSKYCIYMHRVINNTPENLVTDHINENKLDNRKSNLRSVTHLQNLRVKHKRRKRGKRLYSSKFLGVSWCEPVKKWRARIHNNYKNINLGYFNTPEEASLAYQNYRKQNDL